MTEKPKEHLTVWAKLRSLTIGPQPRIAAFFVQDSVMRLAKGFECIVQLKSAGKRPLLITGLQMDAAVEFGVDVGKSVER
jgi:hypothetical protein